MISGSEKHYTKLRAEVCRFMVTRGKPIINCYLKTISKDTSPVSYLKKSAMTEDGIWATDVEVLAVSCMLTSDIFISTKQYDANKLRTRTIWNRYSGCLDHIRDPQSVCLYISNLHHTHYEPVIRLINSEYESFTLENPSDIYLI